MWQREEEIVIFIFFTYNCESNEKDFTFVDFFLLHFHFEKDSRTAPVCKNLY